VYYITQAGVNFLEEALTRRQKLGIGLTAGAATLFGASRVGGKVSSPTPPRPNIVHQQSPRVGPEALQRPSVRREKVQPPSQDKPGEPSTTPQKPVVVREDPLRAYQKLHGPKSSNPYHKQIQTFTDWYVKNKGLDDSHESRRAAHNAFEKTIRDRHK